MLKFFYAVNIIEDATPISGQEIRVAEEARRQAVEEALEQLLARDTQYRKELRSHLDTRMEIAKKRRSFHRQQYKEVHHFKIYIESGLLYFLFLASHFSQL